LLLLLIDYIHMHASVYANHDSTYSKPVGDLTHSLLATGTLPYLRG